MALCWLAARVVHDGFAGSEFRVWGQEAMHKWSHALCTLPQSMPACSVCQQVAPLLLPGGNPAAGQGQHDSAHAKAQAGMNRMLKDAGHKLGNLMQRW